MVTFHLQTKWSPRSESFECKKYCLFTAPFSGRLIFLKQGSYLCRLLFMQARMLTELPSLQVNFPSLVSCVPSMLFQRNNSEFGGENKT